MEYEEFKIIADLLFRFYGFWSYSSIRIDKKEEDFDDTIFDVRKGIYLTCESLLPYIKKAEKLFSSHEDFYKRYVENLKAEGKIEPDWVSTITKK